jgi:hypothetical protein
VSIRVVCFQIDLADHYFCYLVNRALLRPDYPLAPRRSVRYPPRTKSSADRRTLFCRRDRVRRTASRTRPTSRRGEVRSIPFPFKKKILADNPIFRRLSQMILDKVFHGVLDQGRGCLLVFDESEADVSPHSPICCCPFVIRRSWLRHLQNTYGAAIDTLEQVGKVVDSLYAKVCAIYFFLVVIFQFSFWHHLVWIYRRLKLRDSLIDTHFFPIPLEASFVMQ